MTRARRGAALLATVLLCLAAATIALVASRAAVIALTRDSAEFARAGVAAQISETRALVEARLARDPDAFLDAVWPEENARVCGEGEDATVVQPGEPWPDACGTTWTYVAPATAKSAGDVVLALLPPGRGNGLLTVRLAAAVNDVAYGQQVTYRFADGARFAAAALGGPLSLVEVEDFAGAAYASGELTLPSTPGTSAQYGSATSITGTPGASARTYGPGEDAPVADLVDPVPLTSALQAGAALAADVGCGPGDLCLSEPGTGAYLLLPGRSGAGTIDVWAVPSAPQAATCAVIDNDCEYADAWATQVSAGTFPGTLAAWGGAPAKLDTYDIPDSGVIVTDADTYLSLCGAGAATWQGSCASVSGSSGGVSITESFTVVAGSVLAPRDVWLSGPIHRDGGTLGVVATGRIVLPLWARPGGTPSDTGLVLELSAVAVNAGNTTQPVITAPIAPVVSTDVEDPAYRNAAPLTWSGSLIAPQLVLPGDSARPLRLAQSSPTWWTPPPWLPGTSLNWIARDTRALTLDAALSVANAPAAS